MNALYPAMVAARASKRAMERRALPGAIARRAFASMDIAAIVRAVDRAKRAM